METDTKTETNEGEDVVTLSKKEYETLNQTIGAFKKELKDLRAQTKEETLKEPSTNEPDYGKLAYLQSVQVSHPDDQKLVLEEAKRLNLPLTEILGMEHIKGSLSKNNDARIAQDGLPDASGRKGGAGRGTVEYYLAHPDQIPDNLELHNKVIDAKMKVEQNANKFSSEMFVG